MQKTHEVAKIEGWVGIGYRPISILFKYHPKEVTFDREDAKINIR